MRCILDNVRDRLICVLNKFWYAFSLSTRKFPGKIHFHTSRTKKRVDGCQNWTCLHYKKHSVKWRHPSGKFNLTNDQQMRRRKWEKKCCNAIKWSMKFIVWIERNKETQSWLQAAWACQIVNQTSVSFYLFQKSETIQTKRRHECGYFLSSPYVYCHL